jgi:mono/diheme cytochrome c family protein
MNATLFYALGITLVVAALVVSAVGLRFESFPQSRGIMLGVIAVFVVLVGGTTTFALLHARDEQHKSEAEAAESSTESTAAATSSSTAGSSTTGTSSTQAASGSPAEGKQLFTAQGCSGCHTLAAAGSTGQTGPDLDKYLKGKPASFITQSIVDPNAVIASGYGPNIMPQTFGDSLSPTQIDSLVQFVEQGVNGK